MPERTERAFGRARQTSPSKPQRARTPDPAALPRKNGSSSRDRGQGGSSASWTPGRAEWPSQGQEPCPVVAVLVLAVNDLQGEHSQGSIILALWGQRSARLLSRREEYCHDGGMALAHPSRRRLAGGSKMAMMAPSRGPQKALFSRGKGLGSVIHVLWGPEWARLPQRRAPLLARVVERGVRTGGARGGAPRPEARARESPGRAEGARAPCRQ
jgi:hypothetical protein